MPNQPLRQLPMPMMLSAARGVILRDLDLPDDVIANLEKQGISNVSDVLGLTVAQAVRTPELVQLPTTIWAEIVVRSKYLSALSPSRVYEVRFSRFSPLSDLGLSRRALMCLLRAGKTDMSKVFRSTLVELLSIRNFGTKSLVELLNTLRYALDSGAITDPAMVPQVDTYRCAANGLPPENDDSLGDLALPRDIAAILKSLRIASPSALLALTIMQALDIPALVQLPGSMWDEFVSLAQYSNDRVSRDISCRRLPSPTPLEAIDLPRQILLDLLRAGVSDVRSLCQHTLAEAVLTPQLGSNRLSELLPALRRAIDSGIITIQNTDQASTLSTDTGMAYAKQVIPTAPTQPPEAESPKQGIPDRTLAEIINSWIESIADREREVISWRYGLKDGIALTLEEIGSKLSVSRERIRQIQNRALRRLKHATRLRPLVPLFEYLASILEDAGGVMPESALAEAIAERISIGEIDAQGSVRLLLSATAKFAEITGFAAWGLSNRPLKLVPQLNQQICRLLRAARVPLSLTELLDGLRATAWYQGCEVEMDDAFIFACIQVNDKVTCREDGSYGLECWDRHYTDDLILALRKLGEPAHYSVIAEAVNAMLPPEKHITPRGVHVRLMQQRDLFVWVGRKGTYGLKEWGLKRATPYLEGLVHILEQAGHPLTFEQILAEIARLRPHCEESSVVLTLGTTGRFRAFSDGTYGLAEWREEDLDSGYRLQNLLDAIDSPRPQRINRDIMAEIDSIDDIINEYRRSTTCDD